MWLWTLKPLISPDHWTNPIQRINYERHARKKELSYRGGNIELQKSKDAIVKRFGIEAGWIRVKPK